MSGYTNQEADIVRRLREEREKARMSQLDLSLESGVSQTMITYIETGKRTPTIRTLLKLCNALHISPAVLFSNPDIEKAKAKQTILELVQQYM